MFGEGFALPALFRRYLHLVMVVSNGICCRQTRQKFEGLVYHSNELQNQMIDLANLESKEETI